MKPIFLAVAGLALVACGQRSDVPRGMDGADTSAEHQARASYVPGVQLYTVRNALAEDYEGTLKQLANVGYDQVELAGLHGRSAVEARTVLDEIGMQAIASHVNWAQFKDSPELVIAETKAVGASYLVLAWMPEEERQTIEQWREWIDRMNEAGVLAKEAGLTFAYHNHEFEFEPIDGVRPFDLILAETDPNLVKIELDVYWASLAGADSIAIMEANPGRVPLLHIKDMRSTDKAMVDVGKGDIDFQEVLAAGRRTGVEHFFVEHDNPTDALISVTFAFEHLKGLDY